MAERAHARHESPGRPCCGRPGPAPFRSRPRAGRPPPRSCRDSGRSSRMRARGSGPMKGTPFSFSRFIHGFHRPRLQKKPWTRTTPRRPCASAGSEVGNQRRAKRLAPEKDSRCDQELLSATPKAAVRMSDDRWSLRRTTRAARRTRDPGPRHSRRRRAKEPQAPTPGWPNVNAIDAAGRRRPRRSGRRWSFWMRASIGED